MYEQLKTVLITIYYKALIRPTQVSKDVQNVHCAYAKGGIIYYMWFKPHVSLYSQILNVRKDFINHIIILLRLVIAVWCSINEFYPYTPHNTI